MIVNFKFNLPKDQREYEVMSQALKTQSFLWEFSEQLRSWYKYDNSFPTISNFFVSLIRFCFICKIVYLCFDPLSLSLVRSLNGLHSLNTFSNLIPY